MVLNCTLVDIDSIFYTSVQGIYFYQVIFGTKLKFLENQSTLRFHYSHWDWDQGIMAYLEVLLYILNIEDKSTVVWSFMINSLHLLKQWFGLCRVNPSALLATTTCKSLWEILPIKGLKCFLGLTNDPLAFPGFLQKKKKVK